MHDDHREATMPRDDAALPGERFQRATRYHRDRLIDEPRTVTRRPPLYKRYPDAPQVPLDPPRAEGGAPFWEVLTTRRSVRDYAGQPVSRAELSQLLWAAQGITAGTGIDALRAAPSAGALYPVETYVAVHAVEQVAPGVYHYDVEHHALEQLAAGDCRRRIADAVGGQSIARRAGVVLVWTALFDRCTIKYGQRAYRYVYLDAGHIAQNVALAAVALGLASCPMAAFFDDEVESLLDIDGDTEGALYLTAVARPR
jgi:SagB-type dehydrogenase family enzyme